ncbi:MAG: 2-succinyl-5-enolpyruvyl-6-hydroxy-3-cyclohexene-1-carboxylic-acid synthase [Muribaculaceae bacterium]|nr:2-succinyl-5-enolpyruvyl-6-hydroxy-3-cyclohexene-1-carboxylic-acid synthase [Muribaculaceae bacterium]
MRQDTDKEYCRILFDILLAKGVKDIVLSPGSRNAPLLIGADCRPFRQRIITDERTAAFVACGLSLVSKKPIALVCTSGTALYDYSPAIAEAFYQHLPLIVITADRPLEWIDQDDSQTLHQPGALSMITKGSFDIPVQNPNRPEEKWYVNRIINEACNLAVSGRPGPVHINIRLDNPLSGTIPYAPESVSDLRIVEYIDNLNLPPHLYKELAQELEGKRIMVTAGFMQPDDSLNRALTGFSKLPNVTLFCETISNLHLNNDVYKIDTVLTEMDNGEESSLESFRPDVVISIGGALVSRKLKTFLRNNPPSEHWTLGDTSPSADCFMSLTRHIEVRPDKFFKGITRFLSKNPVKTSAADYKSLWANMRKAAGISAQNFIENNSQWSELRAFSNMLANLPSSFNLFLSNGTTVRYAQLFTDNIPHSSFACRGVSGIDGTTATAAGCAMAYAGPTLLITGDMSMAYDTGILGLSSIPDNFKIIVINNQGGGIFRFIPSTRDIPEREKLFCAKPNLPLEKLADAYGWNYVTVESEKELEENFIPFLANRNKGLMEICVDGDISAKILTEYMNRNNR